MNLLILVFVFVFACISFSYGATTPKPTTKPTSGRLCPSGTYWAPSTKTTFHIQYTGTINYSRNVQAYNIDMFDAVTSSVVSNLHSRGIAVVCYFSSQYEEWRPDASSFTAAVLGNDLDGWPGERWVDIRSTALRNIMTKRMDTAVSKGCDAIDVDNVDGYTHPTGFPLTAADQLNYNTFLAKQAHLRGLSIGLKNDLDQVSALAGSYDFAVNEECFAYNECNLLNPFIAANKPVFNIEYEGSASSACPSLNSKQFYSTFKNLDLDYTFTDCCTFTNGNCNNLGTYQCKTNPTARTEVTKNNLKA